METTCLTYHQLKSYSENSLNNAERDQIYLHITSCELCRCAINGFHAAPFLFDEVIALHKKMDSTINTKQTKTVITAGVFIALVFLVSIFWFHKRGNLPTKNKISYYSVDKGKKIVPLALQNKTEIPVFENKNHLNNKAEKVTKKPIKIFSEQIGTPVDIIEPIQPALIEMPIGNEEVTILTKYNSDVLYIYYLKVADYNNLYFNHGAKSFDFKGYTPSFKENKECKNQPDDTDEVQNIVLHKVLKKGLEYFNKNKHMKAISHFKFLLENNPDDVNALFYVAISYVQTGKYNLAIRELETVLHNKNNVFQQEAKWHLALMRLKTGEKQIAKKHLIEIVNEKGFYAQRAKEKLQEP